MLGEVLHDPFVEAVGQEQHLDAAFLERFEVRVVPCRRRRLGDEIIDRVLIGLGLGEIVLEAARLLVAGRLRRAEAHELGEPVAIREVFDEPLLQQRSELAPELGVLLGVLGEPIEHVESAARQRRAHGADGVVLLEQLAGNVQR